jgi:hypothetical protein
MSFSGITQSAENSDFQEVDEVRQKKKKCTFIRKYNESYLKFGFILCSGTEQLPKLQCVICAVVLANEAMKPSRFLRHLNTKHSELVSKPTDLFMRKRDTLKIEKKQTSVYSDFHY